MPREPRNIGASVRARLLDRARAERSDLCSKARVEGSLPRAPDSQAASELAALASAAKAERIAIAGSLADAQRLRTESDRLQREHDALARAIESTIRSVDGRRSELHAAQLNAPCHGTLRNAGQGAVFVLQLPCPGVDSPGSARTELLEDIRR